MNDIIKIILLNSILFYFLIKKNKSLSIILVIILILYLLYLKRNTLIEGQGFIDEMEMGFKREEVKFMKMANLDRILNKILNVYEHSEEDCIGEYTDFTACDKKCGITHKYKTYRVDRKAGLFGKSCLEEDGRRKKELCDESDNVFKCITGVSCQEDGDCETNNCDPKTNTCVPKKVCSNTNLDLCNKEQCLDLNNHYDYALREFKFDEGESGVQCKLEDKDTDEEESDNENDGNNEYRIDPSTLSAIDCNENPLYWYLETKGESESLTSSNCQLKIPNSVFYESDDDSRLEERRLIYGVDTIESGLYCEIGKMFDEDPDNNLKGVTEPITEPDINNIQSGELIENKCNASFTNGEQVVGQINGTCSAGYWPPLSYFTGLKNLNIENENKVPIDDMCKRCNNGYQYIEVDGNASCTTCSSVTGNYNQWRIDHGNNYQIVDDTITMGQNPRCLVGVQGDTDGFQETCQNLIDSGRYSCFDHNYKVNSDNGGQRFPVSEFLTQCCTACENNEKFVLGTPPDDASCVTCPLGQVQNIQRPEECEKCDEYSIMSDSETECQRCGDGEVANNQRTECGAEYCTDDDIINRRCVGRSGSYSSDKVNITSDGGTHWCNRLEEDHPLDPYFFGSVSRKNFSRARLSFCSGNSVRSDLRKAKSDDDTWNTNSLDFYDECCKFGCPSEQFETTTSLGYRTCVSSCPDFSHEGKCVSECPTDTHLTSGGNCITCSGNTPYFSAGRKVCVACSNLNEYSQYGYCKTCHSPKVLLGGVCRSGFR